MLNGLNPILVVHLYDKGTIDTFGGTPLDVLKGIPIPLLGLVSESLVGIHVQNESRAIDTQTEVNAVVEKQPITGQVKPPEVAQRALNSTVTISMVALRDNPLVIAMTTLMDLILARLVTGEYGITYVNKGCVLFNALLHNFSTTTNSDTDKIDISLTLSNAKKEPPTQPDKKPVIPRGTPQVELSPS